MENIENLDTLVIDVRAGVVKTKLFIWAALVMVLVAITLTTGIAMFYSEQTIDKVRIIDRQGYSYSSAVVDPERAVDLQIRAFLLNFCKLCYQFDKHNIEPNLNRALALGDESVGAYIELHQRPGDVYQAVKGLGRVATVNEAEILDNLRLLDNSFSLSFTQQLTGTAGLSYRILATGSVVYVTPGSVDNPNGFCIVGYTEIYQSMN